MSRTSAGILLYRFTDELQVLIVHPGGPFWVNKHEGAWSIPKGEFDPGIEAPLDAAVREFSEELGQSLPGSDRMPIGEVTQKGGKRITAWAVEGDIDTDTVVSNTFEIPWPPGSGTLREFPEVDRAEWFAVDDARPLLNPAQVAFLDRLAEALA